MEFTVAKVTKNQDGGFVTTLKREVTKDTPFGEKKTQQTFYVSGPKELAVDSTITVDMAMFRIAEYPYTFTDEETGEEQTIQCKWLHLKG